MCLSAVKAGSHLTCAFVSASEFNIVSIATHTLNADNGFRPIPSIHVTIGAMLNLGGNIDGNADVKCENKS